MEFWTQSMRTDCSKTPFLPEIVSKPSTPYCARSSRIQLQTFRSYYRSPWLDKLTFNHPAGLVCSHVLLGTRITVSL